MAADRNRLNEPRSGDQAVAVPGLPGTSIEMLKARVRAEYQEMPGMCLTPPQASRLWQIDLKVSTRILESLVAEGFLRRTSKGGFAAARD